MTLFIILYIVLRERRLPRFKNASFHEVIRSPVLFHLLVGSHLCIMSKNMRVFGAFSRSEGHDRGGVNRTGQNKIGECQSVQGHVTGGTRGQIRLEVGERANQPFRMLLDRLRGVFRQNEFYIVNRIFTSKLNGT